MQTAYVDAPAKEGKDGGRSEDSDRSPEPTSNRRWRQAADASKSGDSSS